jgi:hypothetical protein
MTSLISETLYFTKITRFPDRNECAAHNLMDLVDYLYNNDPKDYAAMESVLRNSIEFNKVLNKVKGRIYANCWSTNYDDYALWKIYTRGYPYGICIESTIGRVMDSMFFDKSIFQLYHHPIDYELNSVPNINKLKSVVEQKSIDEIIDFLPFIKRPSYYYEHEYRFIFYRRKNVQKDWINTSFKEGINIKCDLFKLIKTMHYSPFMPVWFKRTLRNYIHELFTGNRVIKRKAMERLYHLGNIHDKSQIDE